MAIATPRGGADGDKDRIRPGHRLCQIQREGKPARGHILGHQVIQTRFKDRHFAGTQPFDLARILVDADHLMPEIGKAHPRHQANIARPNHRNLHLPVLKTRSGFVFPCVGRPSKQVKSGQKVGLPGAKAVAKTP